ncbi:MAG: hypothetical protein K5873_06170 [Treponema sp.]|nr:hypothetical protein [Treponema sp.]
MLNYIEETLHVHCFQINLPLEEIVLPLYMDLYEMVPVRIDDVQVLFISPREALSDTSSIRKHMEKLQASTGCFISLLLNDITDARKKSFLENHIAFVVNENQIYLPFLAVYLQKKLKEKRETIEKFTPAAQLLFLYYFHQNKKELVTTAFAAQFNLSKMTTTRALRQLEATKLFEIKKGKVKNTNILVCKISKKEELFWKIEPFLINPVKDIFYIDKAELREDEKLLAAGDTYLSMWTMIGASKVSCWALYGKKSDYKTATRDLVDIKNQRMVQLWKYNPRLAGSTSANDPISVYMSYADCTDERVNKEKKILISKAIEDSNADTWS